MMRLETTRGNETFGLNDGTGNSEPVRPVAVLKLLGCNDQIMNRRIFEQEQIARAVELDLGASSTSEIEVVPADAQSRDYRDRVAEVLEKG